jgi:hypothetical protein
MKPVIRVGFNELMNEVPWAGLNAYSPDVVVGIARGGLVLAALVASGVVGARLESVSVSFYDDSKPAKKLYVQPKIKGTMPPGVNGKRILLVDDISKTGKTLSMVKKALVKAGAGEIRTFVYAGKADYSCRRFDNCMVFPWNIKAGADKSSKMM